MSALDKLFTSQQYTLSHSEKTALLVEELNILQQIHLSRCEPYRHILQAISGALPTSSLEKFEFLPVRLFKELDLQSVPNHKVVNILTSSGTTSQQVAKIAIDKDTSTLQTRALVSIITSFIGNKRLPMIIIDTKEIIKNRSSLSARGAGLVGMANFGRDHFYVLDGEMRLDLNGLKDFIARHMDYPILIFGFTFMLWQYLIRELLRVGEKLPLNRAVLIHGGGWKKLQEMAVDNNTFKKTLHDLCGITRIHNFYGMVEQVGSIYMECECGYLHAPNFADVLIRDYHNWKVLPFNVPGVIETISILPRSYPGHVLLTEDIGIVHGIDSCPCGRKGTWFSVEGRIPHVELRGCSDTHAAELSDSSKELENNITAFLPTYRTHAIVESVIDREFFNLEPLPAFASRTIDFLSEISRSVLAIPGVKAHPELVSLAYWLRHTSITGHVRDFLQTIGKHELIMPRGTAFHVVPSNVDTIFIYSWALSILAGNRNIVRLPQNISAQLGLLIDIVRSVMLEPEWNDTAARNIVLSYPRNDKTNLFLSERADVRIIWGGDETVRYFRSLSAKPSTKDVLFTDKFSYCLVNSKRYLDMPEGAAIDTSRLFFNDSYQFNQLACSSPRIVYFIGTVEHCESASRRFWELLRTQLEQKGLDGGASVSVDKLVFGYKSVANGFGGRFPYGNPSVPLGIMRVAASEVCSCRNTCGGGFFFECFINDVSELIPLVQENDQTLTYVGFHRDEMKKLGTALCLRGIRRIVPAGQALTFSPIWDGYVLFNELTQRISIM